jgi:hypothetical protein
VSPVSRESTGVEACERLERSGGLGGAVVISEMLGDGGRGGGSDMRGSCGGVGDKRTGGGEGAECSGVAAGAESGLLGVGSEMRGGVDWRLGSVKAGTAAALGEWRTVTMLLPPIEGLVVWLR